MPPSTYDMYGGVYAGKNFSNGKIDRFQGWSRFNAATLNDTRIGSFSTGKEDSYNYKNLYNLREEEATLPAKAESQPRSILKKSSTMKDTSSRLTRSSSSVHPESSTAFAQPPRPGSSKSLPRSDYKVDPSPEVAKAGKVEASSTPRIRHARSASFAPPYGGHSAKPSTQPLPPKSPLRETSRESSRQEVTEAALRHQAPEIPRLHRRGSSDMAALRGAAADFFSSDSGPKLDQYSLGNENLKDSASGTKSKAGSSPENGSTGSRGSSMVGSPTVARTSSSENLFTSGRSATGSSPPAPSNGGSHHVRSASGNVGNLLGGATTGTYSGGGINTGSVSHLNRRSVSLC